MRVLEPRSTVRSDTDLGQGRFSWYCHFHQAHASHPSKGHHDILKQVWGENYFGDVKIVDVNIRRLRMKIEDNPSSPTRLVTIWGLGYKWITDAN